MPDRISHIHGRARERRIDEFCALQYGGRDRGKCRQRAEVEYGSPMECGCCSFCLMRALCTSEQPHGLDHKSGFASQLTSASQGSSTKLSGRCGPLCRSARVWALGASWPDLILSVDDIDAESDSWSYKASKSSKYTSVVGGVA